MVELPVQPINWIPSVTWEQQRGWPPLRWFHPHQLSPTWTSQSSPQFDSFLFCDQSDGRFCLWPSSWWTLACQDWNEKVVEPRFCGKIRNFLKQPTKSESGKKQNKIQCNLDSLSVFIFKMDMMMSVGKLSITAHHVYNDISIEVSIITKIDILKCLLSYSYY